MFSFLSTNHKRKSAAITTVIMCLLLVVIFFVGMKYLDPPEEYGIAVNFGTSDVGMGDIQPTEAIKSAPQEVEEQQEEVIKEVVEEVKSAVTEEVVSEEVATQETDDAIAIKKAEEEKKKADDLAEKKRLEAAQIEKEKQAEITKKKAEEAAKRKKLDALIGGINDANGNANGGEGNDNTAGDKGKVTGDPNASGYYGNGGTGSGGGSKLGKRKTLYTPEPNYELCKSNEEGLVLVEVKVNRKGKVVKAISGVKGSETNDPCLLKIAKEAALKTTWEPDENGAPIQTGIIPYRLRAN